MYDTGQAKAREKKGNDYVTICSGEQEYIKCYIERYYRTLNVVETNKSDVDAWRKLADISTELSAGLNAKFQ